MRDIIEPLLTNNTLIQEQFFSLKIVRHPLAHPVR